MNQEFFNSTLISKYIKYLLSYTPLPLYPTIEHNQYMIEGCTYIHKDKVLKCTESGIFCGMLNYFTEADFLYASNLLNAQSGELTDFITIIDNITGETKSSPLVVTDKMVYINNIKLAKYKIVGDYTFGQAINGITQRYISNTAYYDSFTHKMLGNYLRLIRNQYGLDLMSLYNCFAYEILYNVTLNVTAPYVRDNTIKNKKLLLVPIKFNTKYTIAMDCNMPVLIKGVIYKNGLVLDNTNTEYVSNRLLDKPQQINMCQFKRPFSFSIENKDPYIQQFENALYMAIQVPFNFSNSLVVLEGDFVQMSENNISDISIVHNANPSRVTASLCSTPSLMTLNDGKQHPFSDKLISYLLRNTIDDREYIDENVAAVEGTINYNPKYKGQWDNQLRYILYNKYMQSSSRDDLCKEDILGFVDRDIEDAIRKGYIRYVT